MNASPLSSSRSSTAGSVTRTSLLEVTATLEVLTPQKLYQMESVFLDQDRPRVSGAL
jgi:hypothetical protein